MAKIKKERPAKSSPKTVKIKTTAKLAKDVKTKSKGKVAKKAIIKVKLPKHDSSEYSDLSPKEFESKYPIKVNDVKKAIDGVIKFAQTNPKLKNQLFKEKVPLFLQLNCFKIPRGHSKIIRIPLKYSLLCEGDEVCLIVPEVKGIPNKEHERHQEHYEELLKSKGVDNIKKILTMHEMRTEYDTFELKKRLVDLYEHFLVGGEVSGKTVSFLGSIFYTKRKVPTSVKLQVSNLKGHIDKALSKTQFHLTNKGDSFLVQFGHSDMDMDALIDNVISCVDFLNKEFPGGFDNVRSYNIYSFRASSIPIYLSTKNPSEIPIPRVKSKKPKAYKTFTDELSTQLDTKVMVQPSGNVEVIKGNKPPQTTVGKKIKRPHTEKKTNNKTKKQKIAEVNVKTDSPIQDENTNGKTPSKRKRKLPKVEKEENNNDKSSLKKVKVKDETSVNNKTKKGDRKSVV